MNKKGMLVLSVLLAAAPVAALAVLYARLPGQVPLNWGVDGTVSYGPKSTLWMMTLLSPVLLALLRFLPKIDPRKKNYARFQGYYDGFCLVMMLFLMGMNTVIFSESLYPGRVSVSKLIITAVGLLFVFLGNLMPKVKNNFFMGVRTPWTLSDPDVWNRANRLGGQCFFVFGLALTVSGLFLPDTVSILLVLAGVAAVVLIPTLMSYVWFRRKQKSGVDKGDDE